MSENVLVRPKSKSRSVVYCAASIACIAVGAWVTVPIGAIPLTFTLLAIFFTLFAFKPLNAFASICGYVLLGAIGLPVFAGFKGGIGALAGPTGGFIVGYIVGAAIALLVGYGLSKVQKESSDKTISLFGNQMKKNFFLRNVVVGIVFLAVLYIFGWAWLMIAGNLSAGAAFAAAVAPFIIPDFLKMVLAIILAQAVGSVLLKA